MGEEIDPDLDTEAVDRSVLRFYELPASSGPRGEPPTAAFTFEGVKALPPDETDDRRWEYSIEVEYNPSRGQRILDLESLHEYLLSLRQCRVTPEAMTQIIRRDLMSILDADDLFVEVRRGYGRAEKRIRLGKP
jgi:hypothetical protein